jgi:hypothetical protein
MAKSGAYRLIVVESFELLSTSGHRDPVAIRPVAGQVYPPTMLLECSRLMVDTTVYPVGTKFKARVRRKQQLDCQEHLYCYHGDKIVPISDLEAKGLIQQSQETASSSRRQQGRR